jgi:hypothetical protein
MKISAQGRKHISQFIFFYDEFRVGAWDMFLSQLKVLHSSGFVSWNRWLEEMVGTNGKVGPNPRLVL